MSETDGNALIEAGDAMWAELNRLMESVRTGYIERYGNTGAFLDLVDPRISAAIEGWTKARGFER